MELKIRFFKYYCTVGWWDHDMSYMCGLVFMLMVSYMCIRVQRSLFSTTSLCSPDLAYFHCHSISYSHLFPASSFLFLFTHLFLLPFPSYFCIPTLGQIFYYQVIFSFFWPSDHPLPIPHFPTSPVNFDMWEPMKKGHSNGIGNL